MEYPWFIGDIEVDPAGIADYAPVEQTDKPTFDKATQRLKRELPVQIDGVWHTSWSVQDLTAEEIQAREVYKQQKLAERQAEIAAKRRP